MQNESVFMRVTVDQFVFKKVNGDQSGKLKKGRLKGMVDLQLVNIHHLQDASLMIKSIVMMRTLMALTAWTFIQTVSFYALLAVLVLEVFFFLFYLYLFYYVISNLFFLIDSCFRLDCLEKIYAVSSESSWVTFFGQLGQWVYLIWFNNKDQAPLCPDCPPYTASDWVFLW